MSTSGCGLFRCGKWAGQCVVCDRLDSCRPAHFCVLRVWPSVGACGIGRRRAPTAPSAAVVVGGGALRARGSRGVSPAAGASGPRWAAAAPPRAASAAHAACVAAVGYRKVNGGMGGGGGWAEHKCQPARPRNASI